MKYRRKKIGYRDRERRRKESERDRYSNSRAYGSVVRNGQLGQSVSGSVLP